MKLTYNKLCSNIKKHGIVLGGAAVLLASNFLLTPEVLAAQPVSCANEGGTCWVKQSQRDVITTYKYSPETSGAMAKYTFTSGVDGVNCNDNTFGNGGGTSEKCSYFTHDPFGLRDYQTANWKMAGKEDRWYTVPSATTASKSMYLIRYGRDNRFVYQIASPGEKYYCNSDRFGFEPSRNGTLYCHTTPFSVGDEIMVESDSFAVESNGYRYGEWVTCASQGGNPCYIQTDLPVMIRFSNNVDSSVVHVAQGDEAKCDKNFFAYEVDGARQKICEYRKITPRVNEEGITGYWDFLTKHKASQNTYTYGVNVSRGIVKTNSLTIGEEMTYTLGSTLQTSAGADSNYISNTFSWEKSWTDSRSFSESFEQNEQVTEYFTCQAGPGVSMSVWYYTMTAEATCEESDTCNLETNIGQYVCLDHLDAPTCDVGDFGDCSQQQGDIITAPSGTPTDDDNG